MSGTTTGANRDMQVEADFVKRATDLGFAVFGEAGKESAYKDTTRKSEEVVNEEETSLPAVAA